MRKLLLLLFTLALAISITACGGDDDDDDTAASASASASEPAEDEDDEGDGTDESGQPDAPTGETTVECLPSATVSELTGMTMGEPEVSDVPTLYLQCLYTADDGFHGVQTLEYYASDDIQSHVDIFTDVAEDEVEVDIADQAYWSASVSKIMVVHGQRAAEVSVSYFDPPEYDPQTLAKDIAVAILR